MLSLNAENMEELRKQGDRIKASLEYSAQTLARPAPTAPHLAMERYRLLVIDHQLRTELQILNEVEFPEKALEKIFWEAIVQTDYDRAFAAVMQQQPLIRKRFELN